MSRTTRALATTSATALAAGLLYGAVAQSAAYAEDVAPRADGVVAGIETVGPIATVASSDGDLWPGIPPQVAVLPNGSILEGDFPLIYAKSLREFESLSYRIVDLASRDRSRVANGTLKNGWGTVPVRLPAGGLFEVEVEDNGEWLSAGRFNVGVRGTSGGPATEVSGMDVSTITGRVGTSWGSATVPAPGSGISVGVAWNSAAATSPGLPTGWRVSAATGSPWGYLTESGEQVEALEVPAAPAASRAPGSTRAAVEFAYPADLAEEVDRILIATKVPGGDWKTVRRTSTSFADPAVDATIKVPATGRVLVRVGLDADSTVLWGKAGRVSSAPLGADPAPVAAGAPATAGRESDITTGELPDVVTVSAWDGTELDFVRNLLGVYEQMGGTAGFRNSLVNVGPRQWEFTDTQGVTTRFKDGRVSTVTSTDGLGSTVAWDAKGRLASVTNDIGKSITLTYRGSGECPDWTNHGFAATPDGYLCKVGYPDGSVSEFGYVTVGGGVQLALVKDPSNEGITWGWDSRGRLVSTRSALASQVATIEPRAAGVLATIEYDSAGRAARLNEQPASVGGSSIAQVIDFPVITEAGLRAWIEDPSVANTVVGKVSTVGAGSYAPFQQAYFDPQLLQPVRTEDASGRDIARPAKAGNVTTSRDSADRETRYTYNDLGLVTRTEGPVTSGTGMVLERKFDTQYVDGQDKPLNGMRVLTYSRDQFGGAAKSEFWPADYTRSGLSVDWSGRSESFSAQATAVWTPGDDEDKAGAKDGWEFEVSTSGGTTATVIVGTTPCAGDPCVIKDLPTGPKSVTIQVSDAGSEGWVSVLAAPVGERPKRVGADEVGPGYALTTVATTNDALPGARSENEVRYAYADPASQKPTSVTGTGGITIGLGYEAGGKERMISATMPSGKQTTNDYWGVGQSVALPGECGGESLVQQGQVKTITRTDGSSVTSYFDEWTRFRATVWSGDGMSQTTCFDYNPNGTSRSEKTYDGAGKLIESIETTHAVGGDPRVTSMTTTHGPAAPVSPGMSVTESATVDLAGRVISATDIAGVVTTMEYDAGGMVAKTTQTPPAGSGAPTLVFTYTYNSTDASLETVSVNGVLAATLTYQPGTGAIRSVEYPNGVTRSVQQLPNGAPGSIVITTPDPRFTRILDERTVSDFGRNLSSEFTVVGSEAGSQGRGYLYDAAGRLAKATISGTGGLASATYEYSFDARQAAACGSAYPGAGLDTLRTSGKRGNVDFTVCYDAEGRPVSTTDPLVTMGADSSSITHDGLGRVTNISGARAAALQWGSGTGLAIVDEIAADRTGLVRTRLNTFGGRLLDKTVTDDSGTQTVRYAGSYLLQLRDDAVAGTDAIIYGLPGGAHVMTAPGATAHLTLPGLDGSAAVTVEVPALGFGDGEAPGASTGLSPRFGPYGEPLVTPSTSADVVPTYAWRAAAGQETLPGTSSITLMGARPYLPSLGMFLAPDPILDSGHNLYGYTNGDPINANDRSGNVTEDEFSTILVSAGPVAAVLGGLLFGAGRFNVIKRVIETDAQNFHLMKRWPGRTMMTFGAVIAGAGAAATGYGAYVKVKSSLDSGGSIAVGVIAGLAAAGASYLSAAGLFSVAMYRKFRQPGSKFGMHWSLAWSKKAPGSALRNRDPDVASAGSERGLRGGAEKPTFEDLWADPVPEPAQSSRQISGNSQTHLVDNVPEPQVTNAHNNAVTKETIVEEAAEESIDKSSEGGGLLSKFEEQQFTNYLHGLLKKM
jgi:RHS repeat-associated protein